MSDAVDIHLLQKLLGLRRQDRNPAHSPIQFHLLIRSLALHHSCYHSSSQKAEHRCPGMLTDSVAILHHQILLALKAWVIPGGRESLNPASPWLSSQIPEGFAVALSAATSYSAPHQLLLP